jgi:Ca2+-binding RTX toxin-like protein
MITQSVNNAAAGATPIETAASSRAIDPNDFTTKIDNPYMILKAGTTFHYEDKGLGSTDDFTVTHETIVIDGVTCVVVHDSGFINGQLEEDTYDYFAQDKHGNVWYFGEDSSQYEPGNPTPIGTEGSWRAGVDGAKPGIVMEAKPDVGDSYHQENAKGVAQDSAKVLSLKASIFTDYAMSDQGLETKEYSPLSPSDIEHKFYIAGVGEVLTTTAGGEYEQLVSITVNGSTNADNLVGYAGADTINGRAGHDTEHGAGGNDSLHGGDGKDSLFGGAGSDVLDGGAGGGRLDGGPGADTFRFRHLHDGSIEVSEIADYDRHQVDVVDLRYGKASIADESLVHGVWQLTLNGDGDVIRLNGVTDANHNGSIVDDLIIV